MFDFTTKTFDWFFLLAGDLVVLFVLALIVTPCGSIRLGAKMRCRTTPISADSRCSSRRLGIGLMVYGVSEPLTHFSTAIGGPAVKEGGVLTGHP